MSDACKTPEELCTAAIEGTASETDWATIQQRLRDDATFRALYLNQSRCHALLTWRSGRAMQSGDYLTSTSNATPEITAPAVPPPHEKPIAKRLWLGTGVLLAASLLLGWYFLSLPQRWEYKVLASTTPEYAVGSTLTQTQYSFAKGNLKIELPGSEILVITGPANLQFRGKHQLQLQHGGIVLETNRAAEYFRIENQQGSRLDALGQISVNAALDGSTEIAVFRGQANWQSSELMNTPSAMMALEEGQALEVAADQTPQPLEFVLLRTDTLNGLQTRILGDSVVDSVMDNSQERGAKRFYTVTPRGMVPGSQPYPVMMRPRWQPLAGQEFPRELLEADLVGTFNMDRLDPSRRITLEVSAPCTVYVMFDERTSIPEWLRTDFEPTRFQLRSGPWNSDNPIVRELLPDASGEQFVTYRVWQKQVTRAGPLEFGPPRSSKEPSGRAMYGIAVQPSTK
jgi:hypothetical protein